MRKVGDREEEEKKNENSDILSLCQSPPEQATDLNADHSCQNKSVFNG